MHGQVPAPLIIEEATLATQRAALALLFSHLPADDRERLIKMSVDDAAPGPVSGLWLANRSGQLAAATLAQVQPGRTAALSPPRVAPGEPSQTAREASGQVIAELRRRGVTLLQSLLEVNHGPDAELLTGLGFRHASDLLYLVSLRDAFPDSAPSDGLDFSHYAASEHGRLAEIVERTYGGSLDCPEIDGARSIDDVLAGYRATGEFNPRRWIIAQHGGSDVGCVLLADHPRQNQWELVYMGVCPTARGRGHGVAIVRYAQWLARTAGAERLVLAVDAANWPALAMYSAAGFVSWDRRSVFLLAL